MDDNWRFHLLLREAVLNVFAPGSRAFLLVAFAVLAGLSNTAFIAWEASGLQSDLVRLEQLGRNILVFQSANPSAPAMIDRSSCEALAFEPGVKRAGVVLPAPSINLVPIGDNLPAIRASSTLFPEIGKSDVLVGSAIRDGSSSTFLAIDDQEHTVLARVGEMEPDVLGANSAVMLPLRRSDIQSSDCIVQLERLSEAVNAIPILSSQLVSQGPALVAIEALPDTTSRVQEFLARPGRFLPILLGVMGALMSGIANRLRASEIAVYRLSGTSTLGILTLVSMELILLSSVVVLSSSASSLMLIGSLPGVLQPIFAGAVLAAVWAAGAIIVSLDLAVKNPTDLAKDR